MRRAALVAVACLLLAAAAAGTAGAIETEVFGIAPSPGQARPAHGNGLVVHVRPGGTGHGRIRLTNRTRAPIDLRLDVSPASVDAAGQASLEGEPGPVGWLRLERERLTVPPSGDVDLGVTVHEPKGAANRARTVAVVAVPQTAGAAPAVVQRLALVVYLRPGGEGPSISPWVWVALALVVAGLLGAFLVAGRGDRRRSPSRTRPGGGSRSR